MLPLSRVPVWTLAQRRRFLRGFRAELEAYFSQVTYEAFPFRVVEGPEAVNHRRALEAAVPRCRKIVSAADEVPALRTGSGSTPGEVVQVHLVDALFALDRYDLTREDLFRFLDAVERAHRAQAGAAWRRTLNPLYWLDLALEVLEVVPFLPLRILGRDPARAARSTTGTWLRLLVRGGVLAALLVAGVVAAGKQGEVLALAERLFSVISDTPVRFLAP